MTWFVIFLALTFGVSVCLKIARAGGWEPSPSSATTLALAAVIDALIVVGILVWLL